MITKKILFVEDNPADVGLIKMAFEQSNVGCDIIHFFEGQLLFDYLKESDPEEVILILLDLNMPKMNGIEILEILYNDEMLKTIPTIMFSSSNHAKDIEQCYALGANAYVVKPVDMSEFNKTISTIVSFWAELNISLAFQPISKI